MTLSLRRPSAILIVDRNIILGTALGKRARPTLDLVSDKRLLVTSSRVEAELSGVVAGIEDRFSHARSNVLRVLRIISIADEGSYAGQLEDAAEVLRLAVASRNGSTNDAQSWRGPGPSTPTSGATTATSPVPAGRPGRAPT